MNMAVEIKREDVWQDEVIDETHLMTGPDDVVPVKIDQDITARLVPKVEEQVSQCEYRSKKETHLMTSPDDVMSVKIDQDITVRLVPKIEEQVSQCEYRGEKDTGGLTAPVNIQPVITGEYITSEIVEEEEIPPDEFYAGLQMGTDVLTPAEHVECVITNENVANVEIEEQYEDKEISPYECYNALKMGINESHDQDIDESSSETFQPILPAIDEISVATMFHNCIKKYFKECPGQSHDHQLLLQKYDQVLPQVDINTSLSQSPMNKTQTWVCPLCDKIFTQRNNFREHMETHSKWLGLGCKICGKTFSQKSSLEAHSLEHIGMQTHNCYLCKMVCKTAQGLKRHMFAHKRSLASYRCDLCSMLFSLKADYLFHLQSHVDRKRKNSRLKSRK